MKKILLFTMLFCLCSFAAEAQGLGLESPMSEQNQLSDSLRAHYMLQYNKQHALALSKTTKNESWKRPKKGIYYSGGTYNEGTLTFESNASGEICKMIELSKAYTGAAYDYTKVVYSYETNPFHIMGGYDTAYLTNIYLNQIEETPGLLIANKWGITEYGSLFHDSKTMFWDPVQSCWGNGGIRETNEYTNATHYDHSRITQFTNQGCDEWISILDFKTINIETSAEGCVERCYRIKHADTTMYEYKLNDDCSYHEVAVSLKKNGLWKISHKITDIIWKEYFGFTHLPYTSTYGYEEPNPFGLKKNRVDSYIYWTKENWEDELEPSSFYKLWWDDQTGSNRNIAYRIVDGEISETPDWMLAHYYNENGVYYKQENSGWFNGVEKKYTTVYFEINYEADYGMSGYRQYHISYDDNYTPDTTDWGGYRITEFEVVSLPEQEAAKQQLQLAPNPAPNSVRVSANEELESIALFDLSGRQLRVEEKLNTTNAALSLEGIPAGVYIVRGKTKQGFYQVGKLVKN